MLVSDLKGTHLLQDMFHDQNSNLKIMEEFTQSQDEGIVKMSENETKSEEYVQDTIIQSQFDIEEALGSQYASLKDSVKEEDRSIHSKIRQMLANIELSDIERLSQDEYNSKLFDQLRNISLQV